MLDSKTIRMKVAEALQARLEEKWLTPYSAKLMVANAGNQTDFIIEIDLDADRRYGAHECSAKVVLKWKKFSNVFKEFILWYNSNFQESAQPVKGFLRISFERIDGYSSAKSRDQFLVVDEGDLDLFIDQCVSDLDGKVGEWIKKWSTWRSALTAMDDNEDLCGSWRDTAYFCLMEQVHGRDAACSWVHGLDSTNWPEFLAAQVEYLRSHVCRDA